MNARSHFHAQAKAKPWLLLLVLPWLMWSAFGESAHNHSLLQPDGVVAATSAAAHFENSFPNLHIGADTQSPADLCLACLWDAASTANHAATALAFLFLSVVAAAFLYIVTLAVAIPRRAVGRGPPLAA